MNQNKNYITPAGMEKLKNEYTQLLYKERPQVVATVTWAAGNGDRSENADYIYGKRRLREIDSRLRFLAGKIEKAEVVNPADLKSLTVLFGATVTIVDEEEQEKVYQIVGEDEIDIKNGKISWKTPVAKSLLGKKVEDEVTVKKPNGEEILIIQKIEYK